MNERILLIRANHTQDKKDGYTTFPSGLAYIAAALIKRGYKVYVIDLTLEDVDYGDFSNRIKKFNPHIIGISALSYEYYQVKKLSAYLKTVIPCKIILGGHLASFNYDLILKRTNVDICVLGEGELTIVDLLENLSSLEKVKGVAYRDEGKVIVNGPRELIRDLDTVSFPAYELFDINKYSEFLMRDIYMPHRYLSKKSTHRKMTLVGGRGCPFSCDFCSKMFTTIRRRNIDNIIEEIKYLKGRYAIDIFGFQDELLFLNKNYIYEFCQKIKALEVNWYGDARIDIVDRDMLEMFTKSGCLTISFGVESGSEKILKNMNKKITPAQIEKTIKNTLEVNLTPGMGLILGYPGEDINTVQETIDLFKRIGYPGIRFRYITPYPGSPLYHRCIKNGAIKNEEEYLESLGDGSGPYRFRFNFTNFTDKELENLLPTTVEKIIRNYIIHLLRHPKYLFRYLFQKDFMNPVYYYYNRWFHPTNYDKATKKRRT